MAGSGDKKKAPESFEQTMESLEDIITTLEDTDTPLEQALAEFEKGIRLTRAAQKALEEAEQKVNLLLDNDGDPESREFDLPGDDE